jgi:hypoxanthine-DNA glycosylase
LAALQSAGVALWDVLHRCRRAGSSDAKFDMKSLVANDFGQLLATYPSITQVCFNGRVAQRLFERLVDVDASVSYRLLPSSSPARAMPAGQKLAAWRVIASS